jgi:MFS family permease
MKETLTDKVKFKASLLRISQKEIIDMNALPAAVVTLLSYISYGAILTLVPDWGEHLGIHNKGLFFMVLTLASLLVRFVAGKVSDRKGRVNVIVAGLVILFIALLVLGITESVSGLLGGAVLYGVATGILSPAINAWTIDLSLAEHRGKAMATMYIALEAGIGLGALIAGWVYHDIIVRIPWILIAAGTFSLFALVYLGLRNRKRMAES